MCADLAATGLTLNAFTISESLGTGGFSHVWKCWKGPVAYAAKIFYNKNSGLPYFRNEVRMFRRISATHPNIISMVDCGIHMGIDTNLTPTIYPYIILELAGPSVRSFQKWYWRKGYARADGPIDVDMAAAAANPDVAVATAQNNLKNLPISIIRIILQDVLKGLLFLHTHNVVHNDIKPENFLMMAAHEEAVSMHNFHCRITDFGAAHFASESFDLFTGTPKYVSPETILNLRISTMSDMWSFGTTVYKLLTNLDLFDIHNHNGYVYSGGDSDCNGKKKDDSSNMSSDSTSSVVSADIMDILPADKVYGVGGYMALDPSKDTTDSSIDEKMEVQKHLMYMQNAIGKPPKYIRNAAPEHYNSEGDLVSSTCITYDIGAYISSYANIDAKSVRDTTVQDAVDFIRKCVAWVPSERIGVKTAIKHPFMKG